MQNKNWKFAIAAASIANVSLMRVFSGAVTYTRSQEYTMKLPPSPQQYAAIEIVLVLLTVLVFLLVKWGENSRIGKIALLFALALPINAIRDTLSQQFPYLRGELIRSIGTLLVAILYAVCAVAVISIILRWSDQAYRAVLGVAVVLSPLIPLTLAQDIWAAAHYDDAPFRDKPTAPRFGKIAPRRVVWVIFDELDQRIAFDRQPVSVDMPEFTRLRQTSLYATTAYSPTSATLTSLPSLLTGKLVTSARAVGPDDFRIAYAGSPAGQEFKWNEEPNVFSSARALGLDTALIGWYHPYCRELNWALSSCYWADMPFQANSVGRTLGEAVPGYFRSLFETSLLSPFGQSLSTREAGRRITALVEQACRAAGDPSLGLVFVHVQVPHTPHAYDRHQKTFSLKNSPVSGYLDSLALADEVLGRFRHAMESTSVWDSTTVMVSSDHSYRSATALFGGAIDRRVPFLIKMAGQHDGTTYTHKFNTVVSADLVLSILRQELSTVSEVMDRITDRTSSDPQAVSGTLL